MQIYNEADHRYEMLPCTQYRVDRPATMAQTSFRSGRWTVARSTISTRAAVILRLSTGRCLRRCALLLPRWSTLGSFGTPHRWITVRSPYGNWPRFLRGKPTRLILYHAINRESIPPKRKIFRWCESTSSWRRACGVFSAAGIVIHKIAELNNSCRIDFFRSRWESLNLGIWSKRIHWGKSRLQQRFIADSYPIYPVLYGLSYGEDPQDDYLIVLTRFYHFDRCTWAISVLLLWLRVKYCLIHTVDD